MTVREGMTYLRGVVKESEPIFILRAQDLIAPHCVSEWARVYEGMGGNAAKVAAARSVAEQMVQWTGKRKFPD